MDKAVEGPDRGWSWVIAVVAFLNYFIVSGIFRSFGVIFVAFIREYGISREEASWPAMLSVSFLGFSGAVAGPLAQRFGVRPVVFSGSIIGAVGFSACSLTTSFTAVTLLIGVAFGTAFGFTFSMMPVIIIRYFDKYRATANGISNSGSSLGAVLFPPLFEFILEKYSLSGSFLIMGGITLQIAPTSLLIRPASWLNKSFSDESENNHSSANDAAGFSMPIGYKASRSSMSFGNEAPGSQMSDANAASESQMSVGNEAAEPSVPVGGNEAAGSSMPVGYKAAESSMQVGGYEAVGFSMPVVDHETAESSIFVSNEATSSCKTEDRSLNENITNLAVNFRENSKDINVALSNSYFENEHDLPANIRDEKNMTDIQSAQVSLETLSFSFKAGGKGKTKETSLENVESVHPSSRPLKSAQGTKERKSKESMQSILRSFKKVALCPMFYVTAISTTVFFTLYQMLSVIVIDFSLDLEIPQKDTKYALIAFAIADLVGRVGFGWVTDGRFLTRVRFVMLGLALTGLTFFCFPQADSLSSLLTVCSVYGLLSGCTTVMFSLLIGDYVDMECVPVAFGYQSLLFALSSLARPFLIGFFRDNMGSYSNIFYLLGLLSIATSLLWLLEKCLAKKPTSAVNNG